MADPVTIHLTLETAISLLVVGVPIAAGLWALIRNLRSNPNEKIEKEINQVNRSLIEIEKEIEIIKKESNEIGKEIDRLIQENSQHSLVRNQVDDLKISFMRLQDKVEKITDLIIKLASKDRYE